MYLEYLAGPLVGSVIGYFTNFLAVKMLFHPRNEVKVLGHTLPFTPGVIPKGKPRLARAIGEAVGTTLLTPEDISKGLLDEDTKKMVANEIMSLLTKDIRTDLVTLTKADDELYEEKKEKVIALLTDQIAASISELPIGEIIAEESAKAIKEKFQGGLMAMMLNDSLIQSVTTPLGEKLQEYIQENGASYIQPILQEKITQLEQSSVLQLLETVDIDDSVVKKTVSSVYETLIRENIEKWMAHFQIAQMIEEKINNMPIEDLEDLVLSVMKKELDTIVNLGAVIGFLIGIINIFI